MLQNPLMRWGAGLACVFLRAACGGGGSSDSAPGLAELAGNYEAPAAAGAATVVASAALGIESAKAVSGFITDDGYLQLVFEVPSADPQTEFAGRLDVFGYAGITPGAADDSTATEISGRLNAVGNGPFWSDFVAESPQASLELFAQVSLRAYPDGTLAGTIAVETGDELIVDLEWTEPLATSGGLQRIAGGWETFYPSFTGEPNPSPELTLTIDNEGTLSGSLDGVCAVSGELRPVRSSDYVLVDDVSGAETVAGNSYVFKGDFSVTGCDRAAEYAGWLNFIVRDRDAEPSRLFGRRYFLPMYWANSSGVQPRLMVEEGHVFNPAL